MSELHNTIRSLGTDTVLLSVSFVGNATATLTPTVIRDSCNIVAKSSVARTGLGVGEYTFTLPQIGGGWPQEILAAVPFVMGADEDATEYRLRMVKGSYNASAGTFSAELYDGTGAPLDLTSAQEAGFLLYVRMPKGLRQYAS